MTRRGSSNNNNKIFDWLFGRDNKNDQKETQPKTKCDLVLMEQMPHLFFPKRPKPMAEMWKSTHFFYLESFQEYRYTSLLSSGFSIYQGVTGHIRGGRREAACGQKIDFKPSAASCAGAH
jgi:hypothetical protein